MHAGETMHPQPCYKVMYAISCFIGPSYNGTGLYIVITNKVLCIVRSSAAMVLNTNTLDKRVIVFYEEEFQLNAKISS